MADFYELHLNQDGYLPQDMILVISKPISGKGENNYCVVSDKIEADKAFSYYYNPIDKIPIKVYINKDLRKSIENDVLERIAEKAVCVRYELAFLLKMANRLIEQDDVNSANKIKNAYKHLYEYYDMLMDKSIRQ